MLAPLKKLAYILTSFIYKKRKKSVLTYKFGFNPYLPSLFAKIFATNAPLKLCHTLNIALGRAATGLK